MVFPSQTLRYVRYALGSEDLTFVTRLDLVITILTHSVTSPVSGFCWLLDEILYAEQMNSRNIVEPLFVVSAYRSASTQMARTLAQDDLLIAPNAIMCAFPYLWLWKLIVWIFDDSNITEKEANKYLNKNFTEASLERHDNDHFAVDTFDVFFLSSHLNGLALQLGPDIIVKEFNAAEFAPHNRHLFEECFVTHVDRIARKTLLFHDATPDQTFLLKGHFLSSAPALRNKWPDARFLTVLRDPIDRLRSGINHMAVNPTLWQGRAPNWEWLTVAFREIESVYCDREMEFYGGDGGDDDGQNHHRLAVKFDSFVRDYDRTMKHVYRQLLRREEVPTFVPVRKRTKRYIVDRSLDELGVDEAALRRRLVQYYEWMKKQQP